MNRDLEALEDRVYTLHKKHYPHGKAVRSGLSALQSELRTLIGQYPEATALLLSSSIYRLHRRVSSDPFTLKRYTPRSVMRLRPARTQTFHFESQQDLTLSIQHVIKTSQAVQSLDQLATFLFQTVNQPCLKIIDNDLRDTSESVAIAIHHFSTNNRHNQGNEKGI